MQPWTALFAIVCALTPCQSQSPPEHAASAAAATASAPSSKPLQPLRHYLEKAVRAKVSEMQHDHTGRAKMVEAAPLGEREVKEELAKLDLDQLPNGPLVKCPSTRVFHFEDKEGRPLGSIGYCEGHARFDAPGVMGGIKTK